MIAKVAKKDKAISLQKQGVKQAEYTQVKDGFFDPLCPSGYNFLTGYVECRVDMNSRLIPSAVTGRVNGKYTFNQLNQ